MRSLPESAQRVQDALRDAGLSCDVAEMPDSTRTAAEAAEACGCTLAQIAKSLVFRGRESDQAILIIVSGENRVHERRVGQRIGERLGRADADFVRSETGFAIGGVPPLGHKQRLKTLIDKDLLRFDTIWAAAGTPRCVFSLTPDALVTMTGGKVIPVG